MDETSTDDLVDELQRRVDSRRASGDYPVGLEEQLEAEFRYVMSTQHRRAGLDTSSLSHHLAAAEHAVHAIQPTSATSSRMPGGSAVHAIAGRVVQRHTAPIAEATRVLGAELVTSMRELERLVRQSSASEDRRVEEAIAGVIDRIAVVDHLATVVLDLERRIEMLERHPEPS